MDSSLGSSKQSRRGEEDKSKEMGFLTMEDFKGVNFDDEFHQSMCSIDRLMFALGALIEKEDRSKKTHQFKKVRFFLGSCSNSSPLHHHPLAPGLVHGQYFNVAFDEKKKKQQNVNGFKRLAPPNWALQGCPKKPRSTLNTNPPPADVLDVGVHPRCLNNGKYSEDANSEAPNRNRGTTHVNLSLPDEYSKLVIEIMNGTDVKLFIEKELYTSDVNPHLNRLLLPRRKVSLDHFLMPNEMEILDQGVSRIDHNQRCLEIPFIDTRLKLEERNTMTLTRWNQSERRTYVLKTTWNEVVKKNNLIKGDVVQIWSFQANGNRLHFAITVVKRAERAGSSTVSCTSSVGGGDACGSTIQSSLASVDWRRELAMK